MNGRVYDPQLGRFLSADPFVQDPSNLQALNPYSYVQNNPLSYTDPSGYFLSGLFKAIGHFFSNVWHAIVHAVKSLLSSSIFRSIIQIAVCIATAAPTGGLGCAAISAAMTLAAGGTPLQALKAFAFAMVSQAVWTNVGGFLAAKGVAGDFLIKGLVHGVVGGALSVAQGGNFMQGFASNAIGAGTGLVSNSISGGDIYLDTAIVGAAGGVASLVTGGKFDAGFITAAFANLFNKFNLFQRLSQLWYGYDAHYSIEDYFTSKDSNFKSEFPVGLGFKADLIYIDDANKTIYVYEIKPDSNYGRAAAESEAEGYVALLKWGGNYNDYTITVGDNAMIAKYYDGQPITSNTIAGRWYELSENAGNNGAVYYTTHGADPIGESLTQGTIQSFWGAFGWPSRTPAPRF